MNHPINTTQDSAAQTSVVEPKPKAKRPRYIITLEAGPAPHDPARRLAQLLKIAGRAFNLKCVTAIETSTPPTPEGPRYDREPTR